MRPTATQKGLSRRYTRAALAAASAWQLVRTMQNISIGTLTKKNSRDKTRMCLCAQKAWWRNALSVITAYKRRASARTRGDLSDAGSEVSKLARSPRAFKLQEELGTKPKVIYLTEGEGGG